jgi:hypothetical protein
MHWPKKWNNYLPNNQLNRTTLCFLLSLSLHLNKLWMSLYDEDMQHGTQPITLHSEPRFSRALPNVVNVKTVLQVDTITLTCLLMHKILIAEERPILKLASTISWTLSQYVLPVFVPSTTTRTTLAPLKGFLKTIVPSSHTTSPSS